MCRDERMLYIYCSDQKQASTQLSQKLTCKIGGVFGLAADTVESIITLPKDQFMPGEEFPITF
jgi:hypothetical protein